MRVIVRNTRTLTLTCQYELAYELERKKERALEHLEGTSTMNQVCIAPGQSSSLFCSSYLPPTCLFSGEKEDSGLGRGPEQDSNEDSVIRVATAEEVSQADHLPTGGTIDIQPVPATGPGNEGPESVCMIGKQTIDNPEKNTCLRSSG